MPVTSKKKPEPPKKPRGQYGNVMLPIALYNELKQFANRDDRSCSYVAKKAIREYLDKHNGGQR